MNEVSQQVKNRLCAFIEHKGLTNASFEKKCGLSNGYIRNFKGNLGAKKLDDILTSFPELSRDWLLFGAGSMLVDLSKSATPAEGETCVPDYAALETKLVAQLSATEIVLRDMLAEERARVDSLNEVIWELKEENGKLKALLNNERKGGTAANADFSSAADAI